MQTELPYAEVVPTENRDWVSIGFQILAPLLTLSLIIYYTSHYGITWGDFAGFIFMYFAVGLSLTVGYHRYYSHRAFQCHPIVQWGFALFGAGGLERSILTWSSDHRYHHQFSDRDGDPYNINKGFWWAHMGWMFRKYQENRPFRNAKDLKSDPIVLFQHKYYWILFALFGLALPTLIGAAFGRPMAGFIWAGLFRILFTHQATYLINSAAHTFGKKTYSSKNTARDNPLLALISWGEGYHSFHHAFPADYRNGIAWYAYDPSKWLIYGLSKLGLASQLRKTPDSVIASREVPEETLEAALSVPTARPSAANA